MVGNRALHHKAIPHSNCFHITLPDRGLSPFFFCWDKRAWLHQQVWKHQDHNKPITWKKKKSYLVPAVSFSQIRLPLVTSSNTEMLQIVRAEQPSATQLCWPKTPWLVTAVTGTGNEPFFPCQPRVASDSWVQVAAIKLQIVPLPSSSWLGYMNSDLPRE